MSIIAQNQILQAVHPWAVVGASYLLLREQRENIVEDSS